MLCEFQILVWNKLNLTQLFAASVISNIILFIKRVFERKVNLNRGSESVINIMNILISDTLKIPPFFQ